MNIINFINDSRINDKLRNFFISEVCIKLVALRIVSQHPRSSSQFHKAGDPWSILALEVF